ncbi:MAG: hypothetical protein K6T83_02160 [Alicyclobacillus sp.]|nr:hypothetical protein [Alicyclobacillus sp.]
MKESEEFQTLSVVAVMCQVAALPVAAQRFQPLAAYAANCLISARNLAHLMSDHRYQNVVPVMVFDWRGGTRWHESVARHDTD